MKLDNTTHAFLIYLNHTIYDEYYKSTSRKKAEDALMQILHNDTSIKIMMPDGEYYNPDDEQWEEIRVAHTEDFTADQKKQLSEIILMLVEKKKKAGQTPTLIVFEKREPSDIFFYMPEENE